MNDPAKSKDHRYLLVTYVDNSQTYYRIAQSSDIVSCSKFSLDERLHFQFEENVATACSVLRTSNDLNYLNNELINVSEGSQFPYDFNETLDLCVHDDKNLILPEDALNISTKNQNPLQFEDDLNFSTRIRPNFLFEDDQNRTTELYNRLKYEDDLNLSTRIRTNLFEDELNRTTQFQNRLKFEDDLTSRIRNNFQSLFQDDLNKKAHIQSQLPIEDDLKLSKRMHDNMLFEDDLKKRTQIQNQLQFHRELNLSMRDNFPFDDLNMAKPTENQFLFKDDLKRRAQMENQLQSERDLNMSTRFRNHFLFNDEQNKEKQLQDQLQFENDLNSLLLGDGLNDMDMSTGFREPFPFEEALNEKSQLRKQLQSDADLKKKPLLQNEIDYCSYLTNSKVLQHENIYKNLENIFECVKGFSQTSKSPERSKVTVEEQKSFVFGENETEISASSLKRVSWNCYKSATRALIKIVFLEESESSTLSSNLINNPKLYKMKVEDIISIVMEKCKVQKLDVIQVISNMIRHEKTRLRYSKKIPKIMSRKK